MKRWVGLALCVSMTLLLFGGSAALASEEAEEAPEKTEGASAETAVLEEPARDGKSGSGDSDAAPPEDLVTYVSAEGCNTGSDYLAFASDRHGVTVAIAAAMTGMPDAVSYVCLIGDMVNSTKKYNTSTIRDEVYGFFGHDDIEIDITYGDHDKNVRDDAGIMNMTTGPVYICREDGEVRYCVYGIAEGDMVDKARASAEAERFMRWVDETCRDTYIPLFVVSHVPVYVARADNFGGAIWNEALNYAATGAATTESGQKVIRNVLFLHGHNHTVPGKESKSYYNYVPGDTVNVENGYSHEYEYEDEDGNVQTATEDVSVPVSTTIYYSLITAGYMGVEDWGGGSAITEKSMHATLVELTDSQIILTQYPAASPSAAKRLQTVERIAAQTQNDPEKTPAFLAALILKTLVGLPGTAPALSESLPITAVFAAELLGR